MIAALLRRAPRTWRSTQLTLALSVPPRNHFACGGFHSSTCVHGVNHSSSDANDAQNASGSLSARAYTPSSLMVALARNCFEGGNVRSSWRRSAISAGGFLSAMAPHILCGVRLLACAEQRGAEQPPERRERRRDEQL